MVMPIRLKRIWICEIRSVVKGRKQTDQDDLPVLKVRATEQTLKEMGEVNSK